MHVRGIPLAPKIWNRNFVGAIVLTKQSLCNTIGHLLWRTPMRQSMTIRLEQEVLNKAKTFAGLENRTLTNYIETLIMKDISTNQNKIRDIARDVPLTVFIAEPITERLITNPRDDDTPDEVVKRQEYLDLISGWTK